MFYLVKPRHEIKTPISEIMGWTKVIEACGRTCYKSEDRITSDSSEKFVRMIRDRGHHSVMEHVHLQVLFVCDRGVSHELVRHRLCAFSQESTRYCKYKDGVTFVIPPWVCAKEGEYLPDYYETDDESTNNWLHAMDTAELLYNHLLENGWSPQQARSVLPNSTKTEIVVTANIREWRHILNLRCSTEAHPQMREIMLPLLAELKGLCPVLFEDIHPNQSPKSQEGHDHA